MSIIITISPGQRRPDWRPPQRPPRSPRLMPGELCDKAARRWKSRCMPQATGEQEVASPLGAGGEGFHALRAHGNGQRLGKPFRGLDQLRCQGCVFRRTAHSALDVPTAVHGHVVLDRPHLGLSNALPNMVSLQPGLDHRSLGLAEVKTPRDTSTSGCSEL